MDDFYEQILNSDTANDVSVVLYTVSMLIVYYIALIYMYWRISIRAAEFQPIEISNLHSTNFFANVCELPLQSSASSCCDPVLSLLLKFRLEH